LKLLVYEHVSGGGCAGQPLDPSVLSEGFGMLRAVSEDFKAAGYDVTVLLDARLSKLNPPIAADFTLPISYEGEAEKFLVNAAKINDAAYIIAPETGGKLQSLVRLFEQAGMLSLNCEASAIQQVADKTVLHETLRNNGIPIPETAVFSADDDAAEVKSAIKSKIGYPAVFKPADGVSCGGLSVVKEDAQVEKALAKVRAQSSAKHFIVQEFIRGQAASVSLLCSRNETVAISLNKQNVKLAPPESASSYEGGAVPFEHSLKKEAFKTAEKAVDLFAGLRGYVGVDLVLADKGPFVVDINPRLTTSYVGLSKVAGFNVADAMVGAVLKNKLPAHHESSGFVCFSKVETRTPTVDAFQKAAQLNGVVSPPFPLKNEPKSVSLVAGNGESMEDAGLRFEEAKKRLLNIISRGKMA